MSSSADVDPDGDRQCEDSRAQGEKSFVTSIA